METRKLYYEDCHLSVFTAVVTSCEETEMGYAVTLDATAFYPEGGGQACDLGTLGGAKVLDVREKGEQILHLCDCPLRVGESVEGRIDYDRRFDLMQQHTGEHIVSGIIHKHFGFHNVGFHMGWETVTIDFDGMIPADAFAQIELEANRAVWDNREVKCWYPEPEVLPTVGYRSKKALPWPVRVVEVPDADKCACCGVHVARTGEIGLIKILSCVKFHQGVRLEMVCGKRALEHLSRVYEQNRLVSQAFSAKILETGAAARQRNDQLSAEKFRANQLEKRLFETIGKRYYGQKTALHLEPGITGGSLRSLAECISANAELAVVFTGEDGAYEVCLAGSPETVKPLGAAMAKALNGRGGGKPGFYQGRVCATWQEVTAFFEKQWGI